MFYAHNILFKISEIFWQIYSNKIIWKGWYSITVFKSLENFLLITPSKVITSGTLNIIAFLCYAILLDQISMNYRL